ncbi:MAG: 4Fe-4S dicluster domain-containing protein [Rikenellaceae bacterium]
MLRKIRVVVAAITLLLVTLLFLDFTGSLHGWLGWLAKIQLIPAILGIHVGVIIILALLTLLFGRLYCSVICPLGLFQDVVARFGKRGKKMPYSYSKAKSLLRYIMLAIFILSIAVGISAIVSLLDPYAAYGRIANNLFQPLWILGNNALAYVAERVDSYAFYSVDLWIKSAVTFTVAVITLVVVAVLAWRNGRTYCNTICPVGTLLGLISKFAIFKVRMNDKCNSCGLCAAVCKGACIDAKSKSIDYSRCVSCFNCVAICKRDAIGYTAKSTPVEAKPTLEATGRREFVSAVALLTAAAAKAQVLPKNIVAVNMDGGLAEITEKRNPERATQITPPGSLSARNMTGKCTACQLCVSACPNGVLRPSNSINTFMQPEMAFDRGYCRPECTRCSEVCPSGAITKIDRAEKSSIQIGHAEWVESRCLVVKDGVKCNNCQRQCPVQAISMVDMGHKYPTPIIDTQRCIGCGACENLCPSRPLSAIYVEGHKNHRTV